MNNGATIAGTCIELVDRKITYSRYGQHSKQESAGKAFISETKQGRSSWHAIHTLARAPAMGFPRHLHDRIIHVLERAERDPAYIRI